MLNLKRASGKIPTAIKLEDEDEAPVEFARCERDLQEASCHAATSASKHSGGHNICDLADALLSDLNIVSESAVLKHVRA